MMPYTRTRGALAFFRGAGYSVKFRDPIDNDQIMDLTIAQCKVNATRQNKIILFDRQVESE